MRRSTAIMLLLLTLGAFFAPAVLATANNPLPACCRVGGRHHCSAMTASMVPGGARVQGTSCPYHKPFVFSVSATPPPAAKIVAPGATHSVLRESYSEVFVSHREPAHSQRGPPSASSLK